MSKLVFDYTKIIAKLYWGYILVYKFRSQTGYCLATISMRQTLPRV